VLAVSALTVALIVGHAGGGERRAMGVFLGAMALLTLAFCLILDLDRPISGSVRINQAPMVRALQAIQAGEAKASP
jgi:hypothetical protein